MDVPIIPEFAKGGIVSSNVMFGNFHQTGINDEVVIKIDFTPNKQTIDAIAEAIMKVVK